MKITVSLVLGGYEYSGEVDFSELESCAAFDADEGIEYDEDGVAWWHDEIMNVWYFFDEDEDDWFEAEVEEDEDEDE